MAVFIFGTVFFAVAMLALSVGVIFKKKTPLKGHCHKPVDGSDGCAACGDVRTVSCCDSGSNCDDTQNKISSLKQGQYQVQSVSPGHINLRNWGTGRRFSVGDGNPE